MNKEHEEGESAMYFRKLEEWNNKFHSMCESTQRRMLYEYWGVVDEAFFSQIEINRILNLKDR